MRDNNKPAGSRPARKTKTSSLLLVLGCSLGIAKPQQDVANTASRVVLHEGWTLQSAAKVSQNGDSISTLEFKPEGWYPVSVPTTVLAALVDNKVYPNPYFGMNLAALPGSEYANDGIHEHRNFSNLPMPPGSPFRSAWWFRKEFQLPVSYRTKQVWLHFDGINFRANVWLNGRPIATAENTAGAWRLFEFNVTEAILPGKKNVLAVQVFPPEYNDLAITWVDWNPAPPDKDTGLWGDVYLTTTGPVELRWPYVISHLDSPSLESAGLTVTAELQNATGHPVAGTLHGQIGNVEFSQEVELAPNEIKVARFSPDKYAQLVIRHPRLWWPAKLGPQDLYALKLEFAANGSVSDSKRMSFGIREITSKLGEQEFRVFTINGKRILIRGAGWAPDMLLRVSPTRQEAEIRYVRDMNLNTIRLEGKIEDDQFLDLCDRNGILVLAGWCCCDHWEKWKDWKPEDYVISAESLRDQIRRLRSHPSVFDWLNGSDNPPPPKVEETYIRILNSLEWTNPYQSSASQVPTPVTGPTGLKMTGPYEYVPPVYWLTDQTRGGAFGFNTETSPGAAIPPVDSLRRFLPPERLWPPNAYWDFHTGRDVPRNLEVFNHVLTERYGAAASLEDFVLKSQMSAYEGERAMFEAFGRNKYRATGVIQWMLNNAWPSVIWHLYDYFLRPGAGYFGTKKACEPLHVQYSYDDRSIAVVNSYYRDFERLTARAWVYNLDAHEQYSDQTSVNIGADSVARAFVIPNLSGLTPTYFLRLALEDQTGKQISSNFYWLSTKPDVLDWERGDAYYTPERTFADFTALKTLPQVQLKLSWRMEHEGAEETARAVVENPSKHLAFFVHLRVLNRESGEEVLPVQWEDNYFSLVSGERRKVAATFSSKDLGHATPVVQLDGWNVKPELLTAQPIR